MSKVIFDISISLDGFIAGPNASPELPMGEGGEQLHDWLFAKKTDIDTVVINELIETSGAVIVGGRTYNLGIDSGWGGRSPFQVPAFILTRHVPEKLIEGFTFVTTGIESAITQAKAAAGDKNIWIMGGATIAQQYIKAGIPDEIHIHLIPLLLGSGTRLFDHPISKQVKLEKMKLIETPAATHLRYRVVSK
jgi:dihydrofolate reductase